MVHFLQIAKLVGDAFLVLEELNKILRQQVLLVIHEFMLLGLAKRAHGSFLQNFPLSFQLVLDGEIDQVIGKYPIHWLVSEFIEFLKQVLGSGAVLV